MKRPILQAWIMPQTINALKKRLNTKTAQNRNRLLAATLVILLTTATSLLFLTSKPLQAIPYNIEEGSTIVDQPIETDETWNKAGSPYILTTHISVEGGATLTIEPGVEVRFAAGASLSVSGGLIAKGNSNDKITFTSNSATPSQGDWSKIRWAKDSVRSFDMDHVVIAYAERGIDLATLDANITNTLITNCTYGICGNLTKAVNVSVVDNEEWGICTDILPLNLTNSTVSGNGGIGIALSTSASIVDCKIENNTADGIVFSKGGALTNSRLAGNGGNGTVVLGNTTIRNCEIAGNDGNGVWTNSTMIIETCNITGNGENGIVASPYAYPLKLSYSNVSGNAENGIETGSGVSIDECTVHSNSGNGIVGITDMDVSVTTSSICWNHLNGLSGHGSASYSSVCENLGFGLRGEFVADHLTNITGNHAGGFNGSGILERCSIYNNTLHGGFDAAAGSWPNNVTATENWWGTNDSAVIREHIWDHENNSSLGYVFFDDWLPESPTEIDDEPPEFKEILWKPTEPPPYAPWTPGLPFYPKVRENEPVNVSAWIVDNGPPMIRAITAVFLSYRVNNSEWWNITMTNSTSTMWEATIPGVVGNAAITFFITAHDNSGNVAPSPELSYETKDLLTGDIDGNGMVNMLDLYKVALEFGKFDP